MTYAALDASVHDGRPVECYLFQTGAAAWRFTSADQDRTIGADTYTAVPIGRGELESTENLHKASLSVSAALDNPLVVAWQLGTLEGVVSLTVFRFHDGDPDAEVAVYWKGRVVAIAVSGAEAKIECESVFTSLKRPGLRARYQRPCRHALYRRGCNLNAADFAQAGTAGSVSGVSVSVPEAAGFAPGWFAGGMLKAPDGTLRHIMAHSGSAITLSRPISSLESGNAVSLYPGCDHILETCSSKFGNHLNYGGFKWLPARNPFDGSSII